MSKIKKTTVVLNINVKIIIIRINAWTGRHQF